jgi:molecular chaperone DnaK
MIHLGIDLGTTYSLVSHVNAHGQPTLFPDSHDASEFRTPSVVCFSSEGVLVGQAVEEWLEEDPTLPAVRFAKLQLGSEQPVCRDEAGRSWSASAVSALILKKLLRDARAFSQDELGPGVITVPAQFGDPARRATQRAARLALLPPMHLIEEPVAAAVYYGLEDGPSDRTMLVYDLGGGTFDATLLQTSPEGLYVLATFGSDKVGGKRFDEAIMQAVAEDFRRRHGISPLQEPAAQVRLRRAAEQAKIQLGRPGRGQVQQSLLLAGRAHDFVLTRSQFESLISEFVAETLHVCERCLTEAALGWSALDRVLLVGGSSLVPLVQEQLRVRSGLPAGTFVSRQPHQAVAYGAAILAERRARSRGVSDSIHQVATSTVGLRIWDRKTGQPGIEPLIRRNAPLPARYAKTFYTTRPDQTRMVIELVQSREDDGEGRSLGHFEFGPIASPRKNYPVEVTITYDAEGLITAQARDAETGRVINRMFSEHAEEAPERFTEEKALLDSVRMSE